VLLPQTYGPYSHRITKRIARVILGRATYILSRDRESLNVIKKLIGEVADRKAIMFCPDVAFALESEIIKEPAINPPIGDFSIIPLIGLNVNGLMYNGGYTRDNMFGLKLDYKLLIHTVVACMLKETPAHILLVPHTYGLTGSVNSDPDACEEVFNSLTGLNKNKVHLVMQNYNQSVIKGVISLCDFFIGSRMHACIAALSQGIPSIAIAYSRKFKGVFDSIGVGDMVLDAREIDLETAVSKILMFYKKRDKAGIEIKMKVHKAQNMTNTVFKKILV